LGVRIRPFAPADVPAVVRLRYTAFPQTAQPDPAAAEAYFRRVFLEHPWGANGVTSLVAEGSDGRVVGFVGVLPRPWRFRGRTITAVVSTQLMAEPHGGPLVGVRLLREVFAAGHDLMIADAANDTARRLWEALGGRVAQLYSLYWSVPVRPASARVHAWGRSGAARALRLVTRPVVAALDARAARARVPDGLTVASAAPDDVLPVMEAVLTREVLAPQYDRASLAWVLDHLAERTASAATYLRVVNDLAEGPVGWFVAQPRGPRFDVIQLGARRGHHRSLLRAVLHEARAAGSTWAVGRNDPLALEALGAEHAGFSRNGAWVLVRAREPEVQRAIFEGEAFLSRLDGESWLNF
jgi:hypothetical protein